MRPLLFDGAPTDDAKILEVGCGSKRLYQPSHSVTLDINPAHNPDVVHDLEVTPYPFPDNEFGAIYCLHVLEHVRNFVPTVTELHRILQPGGSLFVEAPYFTSVHAHADPTHVRAFTARSFDYFLEGSTLTAFGYSSIRFQSVEFEILVPGNNPLSRLLRTLIHRNIKCYEERWVYLFPRHTIRYELRK